MNITGHKDGKDPISWKKLLHDNTQWHHQKEILGFIVDGASKAVSISRTKAMEIVSEIQTILKKKKVQLKCYRRIISKLHRMVLIMSGTKGLFSRPINHTLKGELPMIRLGCKSDVRAALLVLATLVTSLAKQPTHIKELVVPNDDHCVGYCDTCAKGAGGIWMSRDLYLPPIVWRVEFGPNISSQVVSRKTCGAALPTWIWN
jgi:hypothetical protein